MLKSLYMFFSKRDKKGFTLIELLIVVAIIAILAAIAIPQFAAYRRKGYNTAANSDLRNVRTLEESMFADFQDYGTADTAASGTLTLDGQHVSTVDQTASLSTGVWAIIHAVGASGKYTTYTAGAMHVAGDTVYGVDSDSSAVYRQPCAIIGACAAGVDVVKVPAAVSGSSDFVAPWLQM